MAKWIRFDEQVMPASRKTKVFTVFNKQYGTNLGTIAWHTPFRKYSFFPNANMAFEATCMQDILEFMQKLMEERVLNKIRTPVIESIQRSDLKLLSKEEADELRQAVGPLIDKIHEEMDTIDRILNLNKHSQGAQEQYKRNITSHGN
jgi:hypothetical protein